MSLPDPWWGALLAAWRSLRRTGEGSPHLVHAGEVRLDADFVTAFRRATGGPDEGPVPLTCPYALVTPLHVAVVADPAFPLPAIGLVHREERIVRRRDLHVGDLLQVRCEVAGWSRHGAATTFDLVTTISVGGERAWESRTRAQHGRASRGPRPPSPRPEPALPELERWDAPRGMGRVYGRVARNLDPIHLSSWTARAFGFQGAVVHGMWTVARCERALGDRAGPATLDVRFRAPVVLPARLAFAAGGQDPVRFSVHGADGRRHLDGERSVHAAPIHTTG